ncbi:hypothetical protein G3I55_35570 [Streptomyces sp. SID6648]|nr:hypothetical protein [Streptomyces sp. SID6648]
MFTGVGLDEALLRSSLDKAFMTDRELALGREGWVPSLIRSSRDRGLKMITNVFNVSMEAVRGAFSST